MRLRKQAREARALRDAKTTGDEISPIAERIAANYVMAHIRKTVTRTVRRGKAKDETSVPEKPARPEKTTRKVAPPHKGATAQQLAKRLRALMEREITELETESANRKRNLADREKAARRLASLVRSFDKLIEIARDIKAGKKKRPDMGDDDAAIRAELERRLARILAAADPQSVSGQSDGTGSSLA